MTAVINVNPRKEWKGRAYKGRRALIVDSTSGEREVLYFYFGDAAFNDFSTLSKGQKNK